MTELMCANGRNLKCEGSCREHNLHRANRKSLIICPSAYYPISTKDRKSKPTIHLKTRRIKSASSNLSIENKRRNKWRE